MAFNIDNINSSLRSGLDRVGGDIADMTSKASSQALSETDMLTLQHNMSRWSIMITMQSNIEKAWGDALKQIAQNIH